MQRSRVHTSTGQWSFTIYGLTVEVSSSNSLPYVLSLNSFKRILECRSSDNVIDEHHPVPLWLFCDSGAVCKCPDLLTYTAWTVVYYLIKGKQNGVKHWLNDL